MSTTVVIHSAHVVYESMFGSTESVAHAVADGLRDQGVDVTTSEVSRARSADVVQVDLLVLGAPTHAFSLSRPATRVDAVRQGAPPGRAAIGLREWLATAQPDHGRPLVAVFDTRVSKVRRLPSAAALRAVKLSRRQGFRVGWKPTYFVVQEVQGPLLSGELERARNWGRQLGMASAR